MNKDKYVVEVGQIKTFAYKSKEYNTPINRSGAFATINLEMENQLSKCSHSKFKKNYETIIPLKDLQTENVSTYI